MNPIQPPSACSSEESVRKDLWTEGPVRPEIPAAGAHVWRIVLPNESGACSTDRTRLISFLSRDERARAGRFRAERDKLRFEYSHGALREILSRYVPCDPSGLTFKTNLYGKPALSGSFCGDLRFNLSHSEDCALVAVGCGGEMGIDIEAIRPIPHIDRIAARLFAPREFAALQNLSETDRVRAFFATWTRKEAVVKTLGGGFRISFGLFEVPTAELPDPVRSSVSDESGNPVSVTLRALSPAPGYTAALATAYETAPLRCWTYRPD